jgi:hypothetical protein
MLLIHLDLGFFKPFVQFFPQLLNVSISNLEELTDLAYSVAVVLQIVYKLFQFCFDVFDFTSLSKPTQVHVVVARFNL